MHSNISLLILGGTIDPDYRGEICAVVHVLGDKDWKIQAEEEVVQLISRERVNTQNTGSTLLSSNQNPEGNAWIWICKSFSRERTKDLSGIVRSFYGNEDIVKQKETLYINV